MLTRVPRLTSIFCMTTIISELDEDISTVQVEGVLLDASPIVDSPANTKHGRLVVKTHQAFVHIQHRISLRQYKLWICLIRAYREAFISNSKPDEHGFYKIENQYIVDMLGYEPSKKDLTEDLTALRSETIIYNTLEKDGKPVQRGSGFISEFKRASTWVGIVFPSFVVENIANLEDREKKTIFGAIEWFIFDSFSGKYEAVLYKLCKDYVGVGRTPYMTVADYRAYMGLKPHEYSEFKDLNKFVIGGPIKKINASELADIEINPEIEFKREGRKVAGFQLFIKTKQTAGVLLDTANQSIFEAARVPISVQTQRKYLDAYKAAEVTLAISRANGYADEQIRAGKNVNYGALYHTAITTGWGAEQQAKAALEAKQRAEDEKASVKKRAAEAAKKKIEDKAAAEHQVKSDLRSRAREIYAGLPDSEKDALVKAFGETLSGYHLAAFNKSGVTRVLESDFALWLAAKFNQ